MEVITDEKEKIRKEEAKRKERDKALLGVNFSKQDVDLHDDPVAPKVRGWRIFYGQFKGQLLREVPVGVIRSHLRRTKSGTPYAKALAAEVLRRSA